MNETYKNAVTELSDAQFNYDNLGPKLDGSESLIKYLVTSCFVFGQQK
jgi:hypothetical protein